MIKYGKPSAPLLDHKQAFFDQNAAKLSEMIRIAELYSSQPRRTHCKNCESPLPKPTFTKLGVDYTICGLCGHLNGCHEDTPEFCNAVYTADDGKGYAVNYTEADTQGYLDRVRDIYDPKAEFLAGALEDLGRPLDAMKVADLGAGAGYFVAALKNSQVGSVIGYEVSESQVDMGRAMLEDDSALLIHDLEDTVSIAKETTADLVSMVGVLEHLGQPRDVLAALASNANVEFIFFSVPLFSPCVFMEMTTEGVFPRHLAGAHTHLYTESSIAHLCREFGFTPAAQWWFGTDMVDWYRHMLVNLAASPQTDQVAGLFAETIKPVIDDMQRALDKRHLSSEVHMLLAKTSS